jgi:nucleoside-diphosphate-sugar epimerase
MAAKHILCTGGAGYIGSTVTFRLLSNTNMKVRVVDKLMYGGQSTFPFFALEDRFEMVAGDIRTLDLDKLLQGVDYVVNFAALVGEHICKKYPEDAQQINEDACLKLAAACERNGIKRFVFASTCSNYGKTEDYVDETAPVAALSLYAQTKINVEQALMNKFPKLNCTVLRFATIYGLACRVRFDLLVHEFIREAWEKKSIEIYGPDGWRPFLHVDDAARAVVMTFEQSDTLPAKVVLNVGADDQNFQKETLGKLIQERLKCELQLNYKAVDKRSYKVNFAKIRNLLGFTAIHSPAVSVDQICSGLESGLITTQQLEESVNVAADDPIRKDTRTLAEINAAKMKARL